MATRTISNSGGSWGSVGTWVEGVVPLASDDVVATGTSGNVSIDASGAVCRSIDLTNYVGILTHGAFTLTIGDATAGAGNIALKFVAGMTYVVVNPVLSAITFISTSATQQTVDFGGKTTGNVEYNASTNGSWLYSTGHNWINFLSTLKVTKGTVDFNGQTFNGGAFTSTNTNTRVLTFGASIFNLSGVGNTYMDCGTVTGLTVTANSSTWNLTKSASANAPLWFTGVKVWDCNIKFFGGGIATLRGGSGSTFRSIEVNGTSGITTGANEDRLQINESCIFTATSNAIVFNGYSSARRLRVHSNGGTRTFTVPNTTCVTGQYLDIQNVTLTNTNDLSAITGGIGDLGGNTGIIFTTGITCYWYSATSGLKLWADYQNWFLGSGGTGGQARRPLAQDDVRFDASSFAVAGVIVRNDVGAWQLGRHIDWTGAINNPTWDFQVDVTCYGSLTLIAGMSLTAYSAAFFTMFGYGTGNTFTLTTGGQVFPHTGFFVNLSSTNNFTLLDNFNGNSLNTTLLQVNGLNIDFNNMNVTVGRLTLAGSSSVHKLGSGLIKLKGTGTVLNYSAGTIFATTGTIEVESTSIGNKTIAGGGKVYNNLTISGAFSDKITVTGSNTFNNFTITKTVYFDLLFTNGTTTTFTGVVSKSVGDLWNLNSTTTAIFTWSKASGSIIFDDAIITKSTVGGGCVYTATANCIDGGGNTGWVGFNTDPFTWTNTDLDNDWSNPNNWFGGVVPTSNDVAVFVSTYNESCYIADSAGTLTVKGFLLTQGFTSSVVGNIHGMTIGSYGINIMGGEVQTNGYWYINGTLRMTGGTFTQGYFLSVYSQGSSKPTIAISGGVLNYASYSIEIDNGAGEAIINNISTIPFGGLVFFDPIVYSGTMFVDNNFQSVGGGSFNADVSVKGDINCSIGTTGTGIIRVIGTVAQNFYNLDIDINVQFNCTSAITMTSDCLIRKTLTLTAIGSINGYKFKANGNVATAIASITGNTTISFEGTTPEQQISGTGVLPNDVTINKDKGMVKLMNNMTPTASSKNLTITKGQLNTNQFNLTLQGNLTISAGGALNKTNDSLVSVQGTTSGSITKRQRAYADGCMA